MKGNKITEYNLPSSLEELTKELSEKIGMVCICTQDADCGTIEVRHEGLVLYQVGAVLTEAGWVLCGHTYGRRLMNICNMICNIQESQQGRMYNHPYYDE